FYTHEFNADGTTRVTYPQLDFYDCPIGDTRKIITVPMGRGEIKAKIWRQLVGRVSLYLLDTDIPQNKRADDRALTRHLYGGARAQIHRALRQGTGDFERQPPRPGP